MSRPRKPSLIKESSVYCFKVCSRINIVPIHCFLEICNRFHDPMANSQILPAGKYVEAQYVEMKVPLYSYGCEKKVKKALSHLRGIHSIHVDYNLQKVTVWGICSRDDVLATIRKKRREARFWDQIEENTEAKAEIETKLCIEEEEDEPTARVPPGSFKFSKSWKKLLPLVLN